MRIVCEGDDAHVARQTLSLRRRWRKRLRAYGTGVSRYVGNHPFFAGMAGTLVAVSMAGLTLLTLSTGRADALDHARDTSQNLVAIISTDLERNVEIYDLSLQAMVDGGPAKPAGAATCETPCTAMGFPAIPVSITGLQDG